MMVLLALLAADDTASKPKSNWVAGVIFLVVVGGLFGWMLFTPSGQAAMGRARERKAAKAERSISQVGVRSSESGGGLACPKCGGTQFKAGRKTSTKVAFGAASLLGQAHHVRCVTCGTRYKRG